jgi:hypothetical protein
MTDNSREKVGCRQGMYLHLLRGREVEGERMTGESGTFIELEGNAGQAPLGTPSKEDRFSVVGLTLSDGIIYDTIEGSKEGICESISTFERTIGFSTDDAVFKRATRFSRDDVVFGSATEVPSVEVYGLGEDGRDGFRVLYSNDQ